MIQVRHGLRKLQLLTQQGCIERRAKLTKGSFRTRFLAVCEAYRIHHSGTTYQVLPISCEPVVKKVIHGKN